VPELLRDGTVATRRFPAAGHGARCRGRARTRAMPRGDRSPDGATRSGWWPDDVPLACASVAIRDPVRHTRHRLLIVVWARGIVVPPHQARGKQGEQGSRQTWHRTADSLSWNCHVLVTIAHCAHGPRIWSWQQCDETPPPPPTSLSPPGPPTSSSKGTPRRSREGWIHRDHRRVPAADDVFPTSEAMHNNLTVKATNCNHRRHVPRMLARGGRGYRSGVGPDPGRGDQFRGRGL
jgi:hypothetical protein